MYNWESQEEYDNECHYKGYRVLSDVKYSSSVKRASFTISSPKPKNGNIFAKLSCFAFDEAVEEIEKLGLKKGDLINVKLVHEIFMYNTAVTNNNGEVIKDNEGNEIRKTIPGANYRIIGISKIERPKEVLSEQKEASKENRTDDAYLKMLEAI